MNNAALFKCEHLLWSFPNFETCIATWTILYFHNHMRKTLLAEKLWFWRRVMLCSLNLFFNWLLQADLIYECPCAKYSIWRVLFSFEKWILEKRLNTFFFKKKGSILRMLLCVSSAACEHLGISLLGCLSCYNMLMQLIYLR